jgi:hypothetical protein
MDAPKRREKYISLILSNLTVKEDARFHAARVGYSGSTGPHAAPELYGGLAPYIATSISELRPALRALRWRRFTVTANAHQWIVSKCAK